MLRTALPMSRRAVFRPIASINPHQWPPTSRNALFTRAYVNGKTQSSNTKPSIHNSDAIVLPGTQSQNAPAATPSPPGPVPSVSPTRLSPVTPSSDTIIPPENVPLVPPPPPGGKVQTAPPTSIPPPKGSSDSSTLPPPPSPPAPKKRRRFRNFLLTLFVFLGLSYAGGVWYSLVSDNFHDFFTEYIPFGEESVLFFEERQFRKRFPTAINPSSRSQPPRDPGHQITIPSKSGLSWKVAEDDDKGSDLGSKGRHMSALEENPKSKVETAQQNSSGATGDEKTKSVEKAKKDAPAPSASNSETTSKETSKSQAAPAATPEIPPAKFEAPIAPKDASKDASKRAKKSKRSSKKNPEVDQPSIFIPVTHVDPLNINNADEPLVQDLVKILNDIITVVNADNASGRFSSTITKAKVELAGVGKKIIALKDTEKKAAQDKIDSNKAQFDQAAKELVRRLEEEIRDQEARWKDEFETEREKISQTYQRRLKSEVERSRELTEQQTRNQLLKQAVALKKQFASDVKDRVETERDGRLSKLSELSRSVTDLEQLTSEWNSVIDANLRTQHLQVAVEAVRSSLEQSDRPRPFIRELAALKEIAADDSIVNSAIASINPTAYQRGVPSSAQLIDRFRRVATEVRKASLLTEEAGIASHAASFLLSKVLFKKQGLTVGDDVESVLTRTETLLEEGNLDEAAREMNGLSGWAKTLSGDWLGEVRKVLEVRQALDVISTEARLQSLKVD